MKKDFYYIMRSTATNEAMAIGTLQEFDDGHADIPSLEYHHSELISKAEYETYKEMEVLPEFDPSSADLIDFWCPGCFPGD